MVKTPVLPDAASRARLSEKQSVRFTEQYEDYLHLGYLEWKKVYEELRPAGKKSVLFVMTDDTRNCDEVGEYLRSRYEELDNAVLVIHTKNNGEISEASTGKSKEELEKLRKLSREIDAAENPFKAIVSVMVLREGWDVQNVVALVGLRPYKAKSQILPEQTLGRGLRRMFRGQPVIEKVSVVGTSAFMDFVESIRTEGVELEYAPMGEKSRPKSPLVVEVDNDNESKDIDKLDIELPILAPRIYREYKDLEELDVHALPRPEFPVKEFSEQEKREIVFKDIDKDDISHTTVMDSTFTPSHQSAIGFCARAVMRDLRLVRGFDVLFGKLKEFMQKYLFERPVDLDDLNILRNISEIEITRSILATFKTAINALTVKDKGATEIRDSIRLSKSRPFVVEHRGYLVPRKSVFNKIVGDNSLELDFAAFLDDCDDIISFAKNYQSTSFRIEYRTAGGGIASYYPDFLVKETESDVWIIETKGREDIEDPLKWERLVQWCRDASAKGLNRNFRALFVRQEQWEQYRAKSFKELCSVFRESEV